MSIVSRRESFHEKISPFVANQLPEFIRNDYTTFKRFVELYYEWMEQSGGLTERSINAKSFRDVDDTDQQFLDHIHNEFINSFPDSLEIDKQLLIKNIKDFHKAKGTPKSFEFVFKALYGIDAKVTSPWSEVVQMSDGNWQIDKSIKLTPVSSVTDWQNLVGTKITQETSNANGIIESVRTRYEAGYEVIEVFLHEIGGTFNTTDNVVSTDNSSVYGVPRQNLISGLTITSAGSRYQTGEQLVFSPDQNAAGYISAVDASGGIQSVVLTETGVEYASAPTITISTANGTGASITASIDVVGSYPGYYLNGKAGFVDSVATQNNDFYQKYSYVIDTYYRDLPVGWESMTLGEWESLLVSGGWTSFIIDTSSDSQTATTIYSQKDFEKKIKSIVHPAGMKQFARINLDFSVDARTSSTIEYETETDTITAADGETRWGTLTVDEWSDFIASEWTELIE